MMRRLSESELSRQPARTLVEARDRSHEHTQRAALLANMLRVLSPQLSSEQLLALRPQLEHAITSSLASLASPSARLDRGDP